MNAPELQAIRAVVRAEAGLVLDDLKPGDFQARLQPVAMRFGYLDIEDLAQQLLVASAGVRQAIVEALVDSETRFFRDRDTFSAFASGVLPALVEARGPGGHLRIWSAAAAAGQEPYSLAMLLHARRDLWPGTSIEIIASDISAQAVARIRAGQYSQFEVQRGLPIRLLVDHFRRDGSHWTISRELRNMVQAAEINLLAPFEQLRPVDVVLCRHILPQFEPMMQATVLDRIRAVMAEDGYLMVGPHEPSLVKDVPFAVSDIAEHVFRPKGAPAARH